MGKKMWWSQPIVETIWNDKYRLKYPDGTSDEKVREDSFERVVQGVYKHDSPEHAEEALHEMSTLRWCPAGRIHAGAGSDRLVTLLNCFVSPDIEDSMETEVGLNSAGIWDALKVAALTQQMGGGIGMDFSTLRPRGAMVKRRMVPASGPLHFMDSWDAMCRTVMAAGWRRGAMMGTLRCDHPDLEEFITAKRTAGRLTMFNVSVLVTDAFMEAVREDKDWDLGFHIPRYDNQHIDFYVVDGTKRFYVYQRVKARELWDKITHNTYEYSEPGVIFVDRINELNNLGYCEYIHCTNPCGEQPLPPNNNCLLGAVNLAMMVDDPFGEDPTFDFEKLENTATVGTRFLDNVIDISLYPTKDQEREGKLKRRIGLGVTGLGNMLQMLKLRYGSEESIQQVHRVMKCLRDSVYMASIQLAKERGPFPAFDRDKYLERPFIKKLPADIRRGIENHGIRNGVLMTVAPTGTTSLYYDNVSSGVEPSFSFRYKRNVLQPDNNWKEYEVEDFAYKLWKDHGYDPENLPDYMVTALELPVRKHIVMQAVCQEYIDSSVSKTINIPKDLPFEDFKNVYNMAYYMGCKGCTTYRPSDVRGSVLSVGEAESTKVVSVLPRPDELTGKTYKITWVNVPHAFYVTINDYDGKPFEIFINSKSIEHQEWINALTRSLSAVFRQAAMRGDSIEFIVEELEQIHSSLGGQWLKGSYVPSLIALIGKTIRKHLKILNGIVDQDQVGTDEFEGTFEGTGMCPQCQAPSLVSKEGCRTCLNCGYSNCD